MHTNNPSFDRAVDTAYAAVDARNKVTCTATYRESLTRPASTTYVVMPDGTVQFLR